MQINLGSTGLESAVLSPSKGYNHLGDVEHLWTLGPTPGQLNQNP